MDDKTHPLAAAVLQQEAGEPVAWMFASITGGHVFYEGSTRPAGAPERAIPLYTTPQVSPPQAQVPLTEDQIDVLLHTKHFDKSYKLHASDKVCIDWYRLGLRDGERSHGIGLETKGAEGLHSKGDIADELGWRDQHYDAAQATIDAQAAEIERLTRILAEAREALLKASQR